MRASFQIGALAAAALVSGTASATQTVVGKSGLVIDVEFWGRYRIVSADPAGGNNDIVTLGDPVHGRFRISADDAPPPMDLTEFPGEEGVYGDHRVGSLPTGAAFVTSRWLSPFPSSPLGGITRQVSPYPGSVPNDYVVLIDGAPFGAADPPWDWFQVSDRFDDANAPSKEVISGESLSISISSPRDFIQGTGLDQEFELTDLQESDDRTQTFGFFRSKVGETGVALREFVLDRIRVRPRVCKP